MNPAINTRIAQVILIFVLIFTFASTAQATVAPAPVQAPMACPCSIWDTLPAPLETNVTQGYSQELGVRFSADQNGYLTGLRFYKAISDTQTTHWGHLWTVGGTLVAVANFQAETASGWQTAYFQTPVSIVAGTDYIASYYSSIGYFARTASPDSNDLNSPINNSPLHTQSQAGYFQAGPPDRYPGTSGNDNFWVDVIFNPTYPTDVVPPTVLSVTPAAGATNVDIGSVIEARFSEALSTTTVTSTTVELRDPSNNLVTATISADNFSHAVNLVPISALKFSTSYTARVKGGASGVKDLSGNALASDDSWSFTTGAPPAALSNEGPGGPILIVANAGYPFSRYYTEILRTEGFNAYTLTDISQVNAALLANYDVVILGEMPLSAAQVTTFTDWVTAGGNLIAMRPDKQLASLLGLTDANDFLSDAYLLVDTAVAPGAGIVTPTIQYHGVADRYALNGATAVATLYSTAALATSNPAVTLRSVGSNGGQAAAFTYDLARSIVYTRQGNPLWAGEDRDGDGIVRSNDLFFGNAWIDPQPDWLDTSKIAIPQADEQQRLLANMILSMNSDKKPLPRFWYLPRGEKAAVVMTGDDHGLGGTKVRFDDFIASSPVGCSVDDWQCIRSTSYIYVSSNFSDTELAAYNAQGFEVAAHILTDCGSYTPASLATAFTTQLSAFAAAYPNLPAPQTNRTHCVVWNDWATQVNVSANNGVRLDTNYYSLYAALFTPNAWDITQPGLLTGSAMPMRFADTNGSLFDVYQATTQLPDDAGDPRSSFSMITWLTTFLDRAVQAEGYYGVFTLNIHTDTATPGDVGSQVITLTKSYGVPVVSSLQMLRWLDGRNASSFQNMTWTTSTFTSTLTFNVITGTYANGIQALLPNSYVDGTLVALTRDGSPLPYTIQTIKGINYAVFDSRAGSYVAQYQKLQPITYLSPTGVCGGLLPCFNALQSALTATDFNGTIVISGVNTVSSTVSTGNGGVRNVTLRSMPGQLNTIRWTGTNKILFNVGAGNVTLYGVNLTTTISGSTVFTLTGTGLPQGYANNITGFSRACSDTPGGCAGLVHNWWGISTYSSPPQGLADASWNTRLGAPVITWTVGSNGAALADGLYGTARITATTGSGQVVMISHGNVQPYFDSARTQICSSYFDIFLESGATGTWDLSVPINMAKCADVVAYPPQMSYVSPNNLVGTACDTRNSPLTCWPIWSWTGPVSKIGSSYVITNIPASTLGGTAFVAGWVSGNEPTAIRLMSLSAHVVDQDLLLAMGGLLALCIGGIVVVSVIKRRALRR